MEVEDFMVVSAWRMLLEYSIPSSLLSLGGTDFPAPEQPTVYPDFKNSHSD